MSRTIYEKYLNFERQRQELILKLFSLKEMVQGSFCLIHVRCGKKHCKCNQGQPHPHYRMSMRRYGKQVSRAVPKEEYDWIAKVTENYREYRRILRSINRMDFKIRELLGKYGEDQVTKTSKGKKYLEIENFETKNKNVSEKLKKKK